MDAAVEQSKPGVSGKTDEKFRTSVYLTEEDITSLDELKTHFRRNQKRQVDRSELIREAVRRYHADVLAPRDGSQG